MLGTAHRVEIEAPHGAAAFELEQRLRTLRPTAILRRDRWLVDLSGVHSIGEVTAEVETWLREIGEGATTMYVDGKPRTVTTETRRRHRPSHADFIG